MALVCGDPLLCGTGIFRVESRRERFAENSYQVRSQYSSRFARVFSPHPFKSFASNTASTVIWLRTAVTMVKLENNETRNDVASYGRVPYTLES